MPEVELFVNLNFFSSSKWIISFHISQSSKYFQRSVTVFSTVSVKLMLRVQLIVIFIISLNGIFSFKYVFGIPVNTTIEVNSAIFMCLIGKGFAFILCGLLDWNWYLEWWNMCQLYLSECSILHVFNLDLHVESFGNWFTCIGFSAFGSGIMCG